MSERTIIDLDVRTVAIINDDGFYVLTGTVYDSMGNITAEPDEFYLSHKQLMAIAAATAADKMENPKRYIEQDEIPF